MDARIAADESPLVPHEAVWIAGSRLELDRHQQLTRLAVVLVEASSSFGVLGAVVAGHDPDVSLVVERHVVKSRPLFRAHADQSFGNPGLWIDAEDATNAQRGNPQFAVVPLHSVGPAALAIDAQWNLPMAELLGVHINLKDAVWLCVRAHPHTAIAIRHARGVARVRLNGLESPLSHPIVTRFRARPGHEERSNPHRR